MVNRDRDTLSPTEASRAMMISEATVYRWVRVGALAFVLEPNARGRMVIRVPRREVLDKIRGGILESLPRGAVPPQRTLEGTPMPVEAVQVLAAEFPQLDRKVRALREANKVAKVELDIADSTPWYRWRARRLHRDRARAAITGAEARAGDISG